MVWFGKLSIYHHHSNYAIYYSFFLLSVAMARLTSVNNVNLWNWQKPLYHPNTIKWYWLMYWVWDRQKKTVEACEVRRRLFKKNRTKLFKLQGKGCGSKSELVSLLEFLDYEFSVKTLNQTNENQDTMQDDLDLPNFSVPVRVQIFRQVS